MPNNKPLDQYVKLGSKLFDPECYFEVGDTVTRISKASSRYSTVQRGDRVKITKVDNSSGNSTGAYVRDPNNYNSYWYVYNQKVQLEGSSQWYNASGFVIHTKGMSTSMLALEADRPTFVREFKEVVVDGKTVREYIGEWLPFNNMSAAKVHTTNEITSAIRAKNDYRKFAIFQEKHVSQAKQPEIEFV